MSFAMSSSFESLNNEEPIQNDMLEQTQEDSTITFEENMQVEESIESGSKHNKRPREDSPLNGEVDENGGWEKIPVKEKRIKTNGPIIELYITSNEKLPKLFAFAKILKSYNLIDIEKVKYVNPYKVRIDVDSEAIALSLEKCEGFTERGWKVQRAFEKKISYGVIKNVDIELTYEEILNSISCPYNLQVASVYRLQRKCREEDKWESSESVRLGFRGSQLPAYVTVDSLQLKVAPYVFPVSQCAKCWKLGHTTKRCPFTKVICPKCGGQHDNCNTTKYKCTNCGGNHMALVKSCPAFIKEKKLRDIMAEFNCTYRMALTMYVAPDISEPNYFVDNEHNKKVNQLTTETVTVASSSQARPAYAEVVKTKALIHKEESSPDIKITSSRSHTKKTVSKSTSSYHVQEQLKPTHVSVEANINLLDSDCEEDSKERTSLFEELVNRLKDIIFLKGVAIKSKVKMLFKCCVEFVVIFLADYIPDWPILTYILNFLNG